MLSTDSALISTLCISTLLVLFFSDSQGTEAVDQGTSLTKAQLIQNPYLSSMTDGTYQDLYEIPSQFELGWKRAPAVGFYGMRGKKVPAPPNNFFGMRGKKGPVGFLGMRGKKMDPRSEGWESKEQINGISDEDKNSNHRDDPEEQSPGLGSPPSSSWVDKRVPAQGFMGLRGKREVDDDSTSKQLRFPTFY